MDCGSSVDTDKLADVAVCPCSSPWVGVNPAFTVSPPTTQCHQVFLHLGHIPDVTEMEKRMPQVRAANTGVARSRGAGPHCTGPMQAYTWTGTQQKLASTVSAVACQNGAHLKDREPPRLPHLMLVGREGRILGLAWYRSCCPESRP